MQSLPLLLAVCLLATGCAHASERFTLTAKLIDEHPERPHLVIDLRNVSTEPQKILILTNVFEGEIYLRDQTGTVYEFVHTNYFRWLMSSLAIRPTLALAPGASHRLEHPLSEFIDWHRHSVSDVSDLHSIKMKFPVLAAEFQPGCAVWCTLEIQESKSLGDGRTTREKTGSLVSGTIQYHRK